MLYTIRQWMGVLLFIALICGCSLPQKKPIRLGIDPSWSPCDLGSKTLFVNGFVDDFLLLLGQEYGMQFEKMIVGPEGLFEGLMRGKYEAVLSSKPAYTFNQAQYDFSNDFLVFQGCGLHMMTMSLKQIDLVKEFDRRLSSLEERKKIEPLLKKWGLEESIRPTHL